MKQKLDIENWARKEHFNFFKQFEEPHYGVTVSIDCTEAYRFTKQNKISFYLYSLYNAMKATYKVESFRYRIEGDDVFIYDQMIAGATVSRANGTFGYGYMPYYEQLEHFIAEANKVVEDVQSKTDLGRSTMENIIRFSTLPWIDFTSLSHARMFSVKHSCPSITFGKMTEQNGKRSMPVSIHVHHALVDGLHLGEYIDSLQALMNQGA
ncbi:MAG: chloramphenicol acetyltransferase [Mucilaginibacter sp.]|uniref:chloramphenicol acetyltransferase n=1 Tax=Mucilaginibacter sp. TaxID=1882438 RepID=UPI003263D9E7